MCYPYETIYNPYEFVGPVGMTIAGFQMLCFLQTRHPNNKITWKRYLCAIMLDILNFAIGIFLLLTASPIWLMLFVLIGIPIIALAIVCVLLFIIINIVTLGIPICLIIYYKYDNHISSIIDAENGFGSHITEVKIVDPI